MLAAIFLAASFSIVGTLDVTASSSSLESYRSRLSQAGWMLQSLHTREENESVEAYEQRFASTLTQVTTLIPPKEQVESGGSTVDVDNSWLSQSVTTIQKEDKSDSGRLDEVDFISNRLLSLAEDISRGEAQKPGENTDQEKARMAEISRRPEFQPQNAGDSALAKLWKKIGDLWDRFTKWLLGLFGNQSPSRHTVEKASKLSQIFVFVLIGVAILFALWKTIPLIKQRRRGKFAKKKRTESIILGERLAEGATSENLFEDAEALARSGDLRAAIRKGYIAFLFELADRKLLKLEQHRTNRDYLRALSKSGGIFENAKELTGSFERHWYGLIPAKDEDWLEFRNRYLAAVTK